MNTTAILAVLLSIAPGQARPAATRPAGDVLTNPFFAMDTATRDAGHASYESQVSLLKELGYAGWGPSGTERVPEMLKALDAEGLKLFALYVAVNVDPGQPPYDPRLQEVIAALKDRDAILWVYLPSKVHKPSSTDADESAVGALRQLADLAAAAGVRIAIYPHVRFYVERTEDAVRLARKVDRRNVGVTFNLCHWLSVDHGRNLDELLQLVRPYLFVVTINGADRDAEGWDRLIQPLGRGDYDVCALLRKLHRMGYTGPIGFQGYGIKGDVRGTLAESMAAWRRYAAECR
jgi:sugar phosphate isomerase/epimerase